MLRVIREALYFQPEGKKTDITAAVEYLMRIGKRRTVAFLISDFIAAGYEKKLGVANQRHDMIAVQIIDPREVELPPVGLLRLEDPEDGQIVLVNTRNTRFRKQFERLNRKRLADLARKFRSMNIDHVEIWTNSSYVDPLVKFFRMRERRLATGK